MPAKTPKQRKAAGAELERRREGKKAKQFKSMTRKDLRHYAKKTNGRSKG